MISFTIAFFQKLKVEVTPCVIMLVRHGDYQHWEYKEDSKKLTPSGKLQAKEAGEALNRMKDLPPIRHIVTSPMIRASESANIILELLPNVTMTSDYELQGNPDHLPTRDRFDRVYANYFVPGQETASTTLLICHANLIRYLICRYVL